MIAYNKQLPPQFIGQLGIRKIGKFGESVRGRARKGALRYLFQQVYKKQKTKSLRFQFQSRARELVPPLAQNQQHACNSRQLYTDSNQLNVHKDSNFVLFLATRRNTKFSTRWMEKAISLPDMAILGAEQHIGVRSAPFCFRGVILRSVIPFPSPLSQ